MATCPQCNREIKTKKNLFGDEIYSRHKMATIGNKVADDVAKEFMWNPGVNLSVLPIWLIDCPMSGQGVE